MKAARSLGVEGIDERKQYEKSLRGHFTAVNREDFPAIWDEVFAEARAEWEKEKWKLRLAGKWPRSGIQLARMGDEEPLREMLRRFLRWAPRIAPYGRNTGPEQFWHDMKQVFPTSETSPAETTDERVAAAQRWLEAEWQHQPETMKYKVLP